MSNGVRQLFRKKHFAFSPKSPTFVPKNNPFTMKKFLLSLLLCTATLLAGAQNISVKTFRLIENDLDARVHYPKRDQNSEVCAIIKVVTTQTGFSFDVGSLGIVATEQKVGEIWVYVPMAFSASPLPTSS